MSRKEMEETKKRETEIFSTIKPESSISLAEADKFWENIDNGTIKDILENRNIRPENLRGELDSAHSKAGTTSILDVVGDFFKSYMSKDDETSDKEWLMEILQKNLPDKTPEEIEAMADEMLSAIEMNEANKLSLSDALKNNEKPEDWFFSKTKEAFQAVPAVVAAENVSEAAPTVIAAKNLSEVDAALKESNLAMYKTITTKSGNISMNPRLDGYIAEQHHVQTFNLNAEAAGSNYRAKVLEPEPGTPYGKNSVDIVIYDKENPSLYVRKYQSKYGKDALATEDLLKAGDYRGQRALVPDGQEQHIENWTNAIESPDGIKSEPLSKAEAEKLRDAAQEGKWQNLDWNKIRTQELVKGIGKQAGIAGVLAAGLSVGIDVIQKVLNGEEIDWKDEGMLALESGLTAGSVVALSGALKVCSEQGILALIPKGTPVSLIASIVFVAIEDFKVLYKIAKGELSMDEGIGELAKTTVVVSAGLYTATHGAAIGAAMGCVLGPVGSFVGALVGGMLGYIVGSGIAEKIIEIVKDIKDLIVEKWNGIFPPEEVENHSADQVYLTDGNRISMEEAIRMSELMLNQLKNQEVSVEGPVA